MGNDVFAFSGSEAITGCSMHLGRTGRQCSQRALDDSYRVSRDEKVFQRSEALLKNYFSIVKILIEFIFYPKYIIQLL